jgi:hypothetical protein
MHILQKMKFGPMKVTVKKEETETDYTQRTDNTHTLVHFCSSLSGDMSGLRK